MDSGLSKKEQELLDFIDNSEEKVTVNVIKGKLGTAYVGCLGRLVSTNKIERKSEFAEDQSNPYGRRKIKFYTIKKEELKDK